MVAPDMPAQITESMVEEATLEWLAGLGYAVMSGPGISSDGMPIWPNLH